MARGDRVTVRANPNRRGTGIVLGRALLEASGGITFDTLDAYAGTGVDLVSSGALTNSAPVLDIGLDLVPQATGSHDDR